VACFAPWPLVPIEKEAGCTAELIQTLLRIENSLLPTGNQTVTMQPIAIPVELFWLMQDIRQWNANATITTLMLN
jgi:hypothetical protein